MSEVQENHFVLSVISSVGSVWPEWLLAGRILSKLTTAFQKDHQLKGDVSFVGRQADTGHSRYVDFAYLDTTTYIEVIFHSQHFFAIFHCISTPSMSKTVNMKLRVSQCDFYALDIFSIIFATVYIEVLNRHSHGCHIVCFGYVHVLAEV